MKRGFTFLFCFLAGLTVFSQAGRPYAIWEDQSLGVYRYVRLDASSGSKTNISVIPGIAGFVAGNATAYNSVTDQYHFTAVNGSGQLIFYTLGRITGAIIYNPFLQHNLVGIEYNPADSLLYALRINTTTYDIVTLDPATGADTLVISCGNFTGYVAGSFCLNTQLQHYSFIVLNASTYFLRTFDLATGLMIANNSFPDNVVGHRYSCLDNAVYGLWEVNNVYTLEQIDQLSGAHTTVDTLASVTPGFVTESYSVNTTGNYTFRGFDAGNNFALFTIDLANAAIIASASTNDNAVGFEEPGFCAGTTLVNNLHEEYLKNIFPVPATDKLFIRTTSKKIKKI
ncbi:MAG: hypothetical protein IAF38_00710, partial [Bacteroidia bacterium]|nr:hypothetical protein [Bacteroidia bacterium]